MEGLEEIGATEWEREGSGGLAEKSIKTEKEGKEGKKLRRVTCSS